MNFYIEKFQPEEILEYLRKSQMILLYLSMKCSPGIARFCVTGKKETWMDLCLKKTFTAKLYPEKRLTGARRSFGY